MARKLPAHLNPLFEQREALPFDDYSPEELLALTPQEKADRFLSQWLRVMHPFTKYKSYFASSDKGADRILKEVKTYHRHFCSQATWSERKYAMVLDHLFTVHGVLTVQSLTKAGELHEEEKLSSQVIVKQAERRRKRI